MLHFLSLITALTIIFTGVLVLTLGDWRKFGLKFAGVVLSTTAAFGLLIVEATASDWSLNCVGPMAQQEHFSLELYHLFRNVAFIIFHIAIGRDAIHFKQRDRRGTATCQKNLLSRLLHF